MTNWKIIGFFFSATFLFMLLLQLQGKQLITPESPHGILSLEFSFQATHAQSIANTWVNALRSAFRNNILLDFLFIPFYGLFLYSACGYFSVHFRAGWAQRLGVLLAFGSLIAMIFDVTENFAMLFSVYFSASDFSAALTTTMATMKFTLVGLSVTYILLSALSIPFRKRVV